MKPTNGYIGVDKALSLIQEGYVFRQNLAQTEFCIKRTVNSTESFKLNKKTATEVKEKIKQLKAQLCLLPT